MFVDQTIEADNRQHHHRSGSGSVHSGSDTSSSSSGPMKEIDSPILNFLRIHHPSSSFYDLFGIDSATMHTYVNSVAGCCVLTYVLGKSHNKVNVIMIMIMIMMIMMMMMPMRCSNSMKPDTTHSLTHSLTHPLTHSPTLPSLTSLPALLGIGDRHLDNILLLPSGQLMHVDFGYSFGEDPKHALLR